jgi:hypothetical protein
MRKVEFNVACHEGRAESTEADKRRNVFETGWGSEYGGSDIVRI